VSPRRGQQSSHGLDLRDEAAWRAWPAPSTASIMKGPRGMDGAEERAHMRQNGRPETVRGGTTVDGSGCPRVGWVRPWCYFQVGHHEGKAGM